MTVTQHTDPTPQYRRLLAYGWYYWSQSLSYWGIRLVERSLFNSAIGSLDRAIQLWPAFTDAYIRRGLLFSRELNEHNRGLEDFDRALMLVPDSAEAHLQRGLLLRFHGDPQAAAESLRRFLDLAPKSVWRAEAERQLAALANTDEI